MDSIQSLAAGNSTLLSQYVKTVYDRPGLFVAGEIAPNISRAGLLLGHYQAMKEIKPENDLLAENMEPNVVDINKNHFIKFMVDDHELKAKVSHQYIDALSEAGYSENQIQLSVIDYLVGMLKANREIRTINTVCAAGSYAAAHKETSSKTWNVAAGNTCYADLDTAINTLAAANVSPDQVYIVASPAVWSAVKSALLAKFTGTPISAITPEMCAQVFGAHAIVEGFAYNGANILGDKVALICRPQTVTDSDLCSWRTCNAGVSGAPEPFAAVYPFEKNHRAGYDVHVAHDYTIVGTGFDKSEKQQLGFLFTDVLS